LQRHQQARLLDHTGVLARRRQSLLLRVRFGFKRREKVAHALRVGQRHRDRQQIGVGVSASPERLIALDDSRLELVARRLGLGPILPQRLVEPQNLGGKDLRDNTLARYFSAMYQQQPVPDEGELFAPDKITLRDHASDLFQRVAPWEACISRGAPAHGNLRADLD
jgi:hypothetical protein